MQEELAVITVIGADKPGIVAGITKVLADHNVNIVDIAQTVVRGIFSMIMIVDLSTGNTDLPNLREELVARGRELGVKFGIVDLSLAPSPKMGDSVAAILEAMGLEVAGAPGSVAALYLLIDAVKKGGAMATSSIGGLSGAFIPVSEDWGMSRAAEKGAITIDRLEAMMPVCNTGVDMVAIPGDTPPEVVAGIIMDVMAVAVALDKALGVRLIPVPGAKPGDRVDFGGLLGSTVVMEVPKYSPLNFIRRGGLVPPPTRRLDKG